MEIDEVSSTENAPRPTLRQRMISLKVVFFCIQLSLWTFFAILLYFRMTSSISSSLNPNVGRILWAIGASVTICVIITCVLLRRWAARLMGMCSDFDGALAKYFTLMVIGLAVCEMGCLLPTISLLFSDEITIPIILFFINAAMSWSLFPAGSRLLGYYESFRSQSL